MTKMTYAQAIDIALAVVTDEMALEKLEALKAQLAKRGTGKKTPTKTQKENEGLMEVIVNDLTEIGTPVTVTELIAQGEGLNGYTNQKISALLRKLVEAERVVKTMEKKKAYFAVA